MVGSSTGLKLPWEFQLSRTISSFCLCPNCTELLKLCGDLMKMDLVIHPFMVDLYSVLKSSLLLRWEYRGASDVKIISNESLWLSSPLFQANTWVRFSKSSSPKSHSEKLSSRWPPDRKALTPCSCLRAPGYTENTFSLALTSVPSRDLHRHLRSLRVVGRAQITAFLQHVQPALGELYCDGLESCSGFLRFRNKGLKFYLHNDIGYAKAFVLHVKDMAVHSMVQRLEYRILDPKLASSRGVIVVNLQAVLIQQCRCRNLFRDNLGEKNSALSRLVPELC